MMWSSVLVLLTWYCVSALNFTVYLSPPTDINQNNGLVGDFHWNEAYRPDVAMRQFCHKNLYLLEDKCRELLSYFINQINEVYGVNIPKPNYLDDVILNTDHTTTSWGKLQLTLDLYTISKKEMCSIIYLPYYTTSIDKELALFCREQLLYGISCRALEYDIYNYLTSLYYQPNGITIQNILYNMYIQKDLERFYIPLTIENDDKYLSSRVFFTSELQSIDYNICKFCIKYSLKRIKCKELVDYIDIQLKSYYGYVYQGELWALQYIINSLQNIASNPIISSYNDDNSKYIIADFVEIGTSNFDTITQLVDEEEELVGFSVEPMREYLDSLPVRKGVRKVHAAIVTEEVLIEHSSKEGSSGSSITSGGSSSTSCSSDQVDNTVNTITDTTSNNTKTNISISTDVNTTTTTTSTTPTEHTPNMLLYYIPEAIINQMGPHFYYLKGCNSVGKYHHTHLDPTILPYVTVTPIPILTITQFLQKYFINYIRILKIDAEGYDLLIMEEIYQHMIYKYEPILRIDRIIFETNVIEQYNNTMILIKKLINFGYKPVLLGENAILERI